MNKKKRLSILRRKRNRQNNQFKFLKIIECVIIIYILNFCFFKKKKIGIISLGFTNNIGNNLLKYAIFIKIKELGFDPYIIAFWHNDANMSFINKTMKYRIIKNNFEEININEYDCLMGNSDQTWRKFHTFFYDYAFLHFAKNWNIPKFTYGASLGFDYWTFNKTDEMVAKECLSKFKGLSLRENGSINLVEMHLGIRPILVLDPTLIIDKKYYIDLIKHYKNEINDKGNILFTYLIFDERNTNNFINKSCYQLNYTLNAVKMNDNNSIEKFLLGIVNSKAVITDSYHGTLFSIIFKKPFIAFIHRTFAKERFLSLRQLLKLENRIVDYNITPDISLLSTPLDINYDLLNSLKIKSINFLKKNLEI